MATIRGGLILLFWDFNVLKWRTEEDFTPNGGSTEGKQWYRIPDNFTYVGEESFQENKPFYLKKGFLITQQGDMSKTEIYYGEIQDKPIFPLETEVDTQVPFIKSKDLTNTSDVYNWFIPVDPTRHGRGLSTLESGGNIS